MARHRAAVGHGRARSAGIGGERGASGPYYAPFIYSRHRHTSTFQAAEALARAVPDTREKGRREHRERVEAVVAVLKEAQLGEDVTRWAMRVLQSRNDKPLRQLMEELISSAGDMGRELLAAVRRTAGTRLIESGAGLPLAAASACTGTPAGSRARSTRSR